MSDFTLVDNYKREMNGYTLKVLYLMEKGWELQYDTSTQPFPEVYLRKSGYVSIGEAPSLLDTLLREKLIICDGKYPLSSYKLNKKEFKKLKK